MILNLPRCVCVKNCMCQESYDPRPRHSHVVKLAKVANHAIAAIMRDYAIDERIRRYRGLEANELHPVSHNVIGGTLKRALETRLKIIKPSVITPFVIAAGPTT